MYVVFKDNYVTVAFVLVGGTVQGATPTWSMVDVQCRKRFLAGWMVFMRNPGAH